MTLEASICLYNLTLQKQSNSIRSVAGNFNGKKSQEIITATSNTLTVYKADSTSGKLTLLLSVQVFAIIRSISNFKIAGSGKDYLALTSDSGNLSILELDLEKQKFIPLFNEPYHKSGIRRLAPGQDITVDSKGRAILVSAIERNKLVYVVNRDLENNLTISSPLEANKSKLLTLSTVGLDVVYENPLFASIEIDYSEYENNDTPEFKRLLTLYELDLSLNNVVRRNSESIPITSNLLLPVPGGSEGPSGVIVCSTNLISYRGLSGEKLSIKIPQIQDNETDLVIVFGVLHKMKDQFFFLVQTNLGDLFKVELYDDKLSISYFDTIPVASSLIILKTGFLYADTEYGDKHFYQFETLGTEEPASSTTDHPIEEIHFIRKEEPTNILLVDIIPSLNSLLDSKFVNDDAFTKIYGISGHGKSSSLRVLQYGVSTTEVVESELPGVAQRVWTTKLHKNEDYHRYLVISFIDTTLVLSIGESVDEVSDSGLALDEQTIGVEQIGSNSIAQIHSNGIRVIKNEKLKHEWLPPAGIKILSCSTTNRQIVVGLSNDELVYFEVDDYDRLVEYGERKEMQSRIISLTLGEIPEGKLRSNFLVVGCQDSTIRVLSTDPSSTLESLSLQALSAPPSSLLISKHDNQLYVNIGLENGVFVRTSLDERSGQLSDTRTKYLGNKPITLNRVIANDQTVVLAFSNKTWIIHDTNGFKINTLLVNPLAFGSVFNSEDCTNGAVGIYKRSLTIFTIDELTNDFNLNSIELSNSPKNLLKSENSLFITERSSKQSNIEKFSIESNEIENSVQLESNESIIASTTTHFESNDKTYLIVSIAKDYDPSTGQFSESYLSTFDTDLQFIHKTPIPEISLSLVEFQGKVLVGLKNQLRLFDLGLKQLLSKASSKIESISNIVKIEAQGSRVFVGDIKESITFLTYRPKSNEFIPFVDDVISRHISSFKVVDYNTVIGGDKFGNLFVLRCDDEPSTKSDSDPTFLINQDEYLNGCPYKLTNPCNFFIDDIATSFNKGAFTQGGKDIIIYTGLQGTVGALIPLPTKSDIRFFTSLQKAIREHQPDLTGRLGLIYRGYYQPSKNVIDGDLIEVFNTLAAPVQTLIAKEVDKTPKEVLRKIYEIRSISI